MKCYILYRVDPLSYRDILRWDKGTCIHVPLFCCSWKWLVKLYSHFVLSNFISESLDERGEPESVNDSNYDTIVIEKTTKLINTNEN